MRATCELKSAKERGDKGSGLSGRKWRVDAARRLHYALPVIHDATGIHQLRELTRLEILRRETPNATRARCVKMRRRENKRKREERKKETRREMKREYTRRQRKQEREGCPVVIGGQDGWRYLFALALRN